MNAELDVKRAVADRFGLGEAAAGFLTGSSIAELEESAGALRRLMAEHRPEPEHPEPANIVAVARAAKMARKEELLAMFSGRPTTQPRDQAGRFAGFDGGARTPIPTPRSPEREHDEVILGLARLRALGDAGLAAQ